MFTIFESQAIFHAHDTEQEAQQVAANPPRGLFSTETPLEQKRLLEIYRQRRKQRQQETAAEAKEREHRLAL